MRRVLGAPAWSGPVARALDIGCGAGASTVALAPLARSRLGIDPSPAMVAAAVRAVRDASFAVARAESIPVATGAIDLIAAAGSLDFADVGAFVAEADRTLRPGGRVVVSDFSFGRPENAAEWPEVLAARWPRRPAVPVTSATFAGGPFRVVVDEQFVVTLHLSLESYLAYAMTETNVARAVAAGTPAREIRAWCAETLGGWTGVTPVAFACSVLVLAR